MIGISVGDIIKVLDQIPIWKTLRDLPKRVEALEARIKELEQPKLPTKPIIPEGRICPMCSGEMKVVREEPDPTFGMMGMKVHHMKCETCGHEADRQWTAKGGYQ